MGVDLVLKWALVAIVMLSMAFGFGLGKLF